MEYLIRYSLPLEFVDYIITAKNELTLATYISMLANEGAYNIRVEVQKHEK